MDHGTLALGRRWNTYYFHQPGNIRMRGYYYADYVLFDLATETWTDGQRFGPDEWPGSRCIRAHPVWTGSEWRLYYHTDLTQEPYWRRLWRDDTMLYEISDANYTQWYYTVLAGAFVLRGIGVLLTERGLYVDGDVGEYVAWPDDDHLWQRYRSWWPLGGRHWEVGAGDDAVRRILAINIDGEGRLWDWDPEGGFTNHTALLDGTIDDSEWDEPGPLVGLRRIYI